MGINDCVRLALPVCRAPLEARLHVLGGRLGGRAAPALATLQNHPNPAQRGLRATTCSAGRALLFTGM